MEAMLAAAGLPGRRFAALTPEAIPPTIAARFSPAGALSAGERGCLASHLAALEHVAAAPEGWHAILEDDVDIIGDLNAVAAELAAMPVPPDVLRLENPLKCAAIRVRAGAGFDFVRPLHVPNSSAGYLVSPQGAAAVLAHANAIDMVADQFLRRLGRGAVDMLVCAPPPLRLRDEQSTIADPHGRGRRLGAQRRGGWFISALLAQIGRFGLIDFIRVVAATLHMRLAGVRLDVERRFILDPVRS
jgi:GR25 family glycosyltransferase involved in LPS biosynthesis